MYFRAVAGLVSGLCAGVVTGIMFLVMSVPDTDGLAVPMLTVISRAVGYNDSAVGWSFHLFNSAIIGLLFGALAFPFTKNMMQSALAGLVAGLIWWFLASVLMLPTLIGLSMFATVTNPVMQPVMVGTLIGSIVFGVLMGVIFLLLYQPIEVYEQQESAPPAPTESERERIGAR